MNVNANGLSVFSDRHLKNSSDQQDIYRNDHRDPHQHHHVLTALCKPRLMAIHDTMDLISGKWKVSIISYLQTMGKSRFMELQNNIEGIGAKMLSKELKDLEINELVTRTVLQSRPVKVEYELTDYGRTLEHIIDELCVWGFKHRQRILNRQTECACGEDPTQGCEHHGVKMQRLEDDQVNTAHHQPIETV